MVKFNEKLNDSLNEIISEIDLKTNDIISSFDEYNDYHNIDEEIVIGLKKIIIQKIIKKLDLLENE